MSADSIASKVLATVPKCVAAGVVDLSTGLLLAVKTTDSHPQDVLDLVAAATSDLFEGDNVTAIEQAFKRARRVDSSERYFKEIVVFSTHLLHVFGRLSSKPDVVVVSVCRKDANLGMVLSKFREVTTAEVL